MSEVEKTIEELEAEVMAELEEGMHDAPTKGAVPAEPMKKKKNGEMQDTGAAVVSPTQGDAPAKKVAGAAKEISGDPQQKGEGAPDKMKKLNAMKHKNGMEEGYTDEEIRELCHSKDHDCATVVEHPVWGKGKPVHGSHAIPTDEGFVEWYDVQFKHGIEEKVMADDMKIMVSEAHHEDMKMPKTKNGMITAMKNMMMDMEKGMKKDQLMAAYHKMEGMHKKMTEGGHLPSEKNEAVEKRVKNINVKEHVDALMNGEGDLSEEFKMKAATVFEAAVKSKIRDEVERLEEEYKSELEESIKETKEELSEKVDTYLNYVVEEWMKENELAIERGLKGEIAEDFISGLKTLFEDHYVDIPDEKYDVLEAQSEKITELEGKLDEAISNIVTLRKDNGSLVREKAISEATEDLADTEIEKFKSLTEDVDFTDESSFKAKLDTLKESYFPKTKPVETQTVDDVETGNAQDVDTTESMSSYMRAIGKFGNGAK
jgi:flagellin-like hook-associated protein FlgL